MATLHHQEVSPPSSRHEFILWMRNRPRLYGIPLFPEHLPPESAARLGLLAHTTRQAVAAAVAGCDLIQLRWKHPPGTGPMLDLTRRWRREIADSAPLTRLVLNDRPDVAAMAEVDLIHLGQEDLPVPMARRVVAPSTILGLSTHTVRQVEQAEDLDVDYLAFGPVFATTTKANPDPTTGLKLLETVCRRSRHPMVAIGGIGAVQVSSVIAAGASAVAVGSGIFVLGEDVAQTVARVQSYRQAMTRASSVTPHAGQGSLPCFDDSQRLD